MTNAQKLASHTEQLADLIYRADDVSDDICTAEFNEADEVVNCRYPDNDKGCLKCIQEWLGKEAADGEDK